MEWWIWMPNGSYSVSDIEDYIEFIIKKHETLTTIPPIYVFINRTNNGLVFKIKDGSKLELQTPESSQTLIKLWNLMNIEEMLKK